MGITAMGFSINYQNTGSRPAPAAEVLVSLGQIPPNVAKIVSKISVVMTRETLAIAREGFHCGIPKFCPPCCVAEPCCPDHDVVPSYVAGRKLRHKVPIDEDEIGVGRGIF